MRWFVAVLLSLHGIAHLVGFRAAFWPTTVSPSRRLVQLPRQLEGALWLLLGLGFVVTAVLLLRRREELPFVLLGAVLASLVMCLNAWQEAWIGLVIDAALLALSLVSWPAHAGSFAQRFERELEARQLLAPARASEVVDAKVVAALPSSVRRYLEFMRVVGRERDVSLRASFSGRFRRDESGWLACEVEQYDSRAPVTRVFMMQLSLDQLLPVTVRDEYVRGRGSLEAKAFDVARVAHGDGYELDVGELVTYLNDAILMAPSLLLGPETSWTEVDASAFDVALTDGASTVKARVLLDARGAPTNFITTDRFFDAPDGRRVRTEWRTPIDGYQEANGRRLPTRAQAVWQLPVGPFPYADFDFDPARISFNAGPP